MKLNKSINKLHLIACLLFLSLSLLAETKLIPSHNLNHKEKSSIKKEFIGQVEGQDVFQYTLENKTGMQVQVINYGATITNIVTHDKQGQMNSVVLGLDSLSHYAGWQNSLMGSTVGRVANRISNKKFKSTVRNISSHLIFMVV